MDIDKFIDDGLDAFLIANPKATDNELELEEERLVAEFDRGQSERYIDQPVPQEDQSILGGFKRDIQQSPALNRAISTVFPSYADKGVVAAGDVLGAPGKAYYQGAQGLAEAAGLGDPKGVGGTQGKPGMIADIVGDPALPVSIATGGMGAKLAARGLQGLGKYMSYELPTAASGVIPKTLMKGVEAVGEQLPASAFSPANEIGTETVAAGFLGTSLPIVGKVAKPLKEFTKDVLSEASGRSKELLSKVGARESKQWVKGLLEGDNVKPDEVLTQLSSFADNAELVADDILKTVDNFDVMFRKENDVIERALTQMPNMDAAPLIQKLKSSKLKTGKAGVFGQQANQKGFGNEVAFNSQIDGMVNKIEQKVKERNPYMGIGTVRRTELTPHDMLDIRRDIDNSVNWDAENFSKQYYAPIQKLKKESRTFIKDALVSTADAAGQPEYKHAMKEYSRLLELQDKVKRNIMPRANDIGEVDRAKNFLLRMSSPNEIDKQLFAKQFKEVLGKDLFEDAKLLKLSKEYRDALPIANDIATGKKNWLQSFADTGGGKIALAPFSSPKVNAPIFAGMELGEQALKRYSPGMAKAGRQAQPLIVKEQYGDNK